MNLNPYLTYIKIGAAVVLATVLTGTGYHFGTLSGDEKADAAKATMETDHANMADAATKALISQRAQVIAEAAADHKTEQTHANELAAIDNTPPRSDPVRVYVKTPGAVCIPAVPGAEGQAHSVAADPAKGGSQPVDRGRDIRPAIEALKKRLEKIMADYRQEDSEWPPK